MKFDIGGPGEVSGVGYGGDALGPFTAGADGIIEVPDDFQEAIALLDSAAGVSRVLTPDPKPPKRKET